MTTPDEVTGPVNLGNPPEFSVLELAKMVIDLVGSSSRIVHRPLPENDPKQRQPDISRAQELLDWRPHTALKDGLLSTIEYFEGLLKEHEGYCSKERRHSSTKP
jgi:UDP-glucuronate decarboxylase